MKTIFFSLFCFSLVCCANAQDLITIQGKVIDSLTKEPLPLTQVFIQGTTKGTTTNLDGEFSLSLTNQGTYELVCYFIGYKTDVKIVRTGSSQSVTQNFSLLQEVKELEAITIKGISQKDWLYCYEVFKYDFLGQTQMASRAKILNEQVLDFQLIENKQGQEVKGKSSDFLIIENQALGYKVYCDLERFQDFNSKLYSYLGKFRFEEIIEDDEKKHNRWNRNRETAYLGSFQHFIHSLMQDKLREEGFLVVDDRNVPMNKADLMKLIEKDNIWTMQFYGKLTITYLKESEEIGYSQLLKRTPLKTQTSWMTLEPANSNILIDDKGYIFNPLNLMVFGYWNWEKVAEMVPLDYIPEKK